MSKELGWTDLMVDVFNKLAKEHASVTYTFKDFVVELPGAAGKSTGISHIKLTGSITIESTVRS